MRTKNFIFLLALVILFSFLLIILGPGNSTNITNIQNIANQQFKQIKENLRTEKEKQLDVDEKYLRLLGFQEDVSTTRGGSTNLLNTTKQNFSVVSYVLEGQLAASILQLQNLASVMANENLHIYNLGLSEEDLQTLSITCNSSNIKCTIIQPDFSVYPLYIMDDKFHLYRPLIIKHALSKFKTILFTGNHVRLRGNSKVFYDIKRKTEEQNHVKSLEIKKLPVTSSTHPRMFDYFDSDDDSFLFVRQVTLDAVFFHQSKFLDDKILLPWIKCVLTPQCIQPIGASSNTNHCKFNKKPAYRYSGCHGYDESAFNVVCGLAFNFNEAKYSLTDNDSALFYKEKLEDSIRILEIRKRNISEHHPYTSEHPYNDE
ncbi:CLUMA_CG001071, isoform A [Clunio marinus]|uniref:CLUMA_CG001071, isoform A n=1 Tax=Clunio marinus TaxID=568069 RepID=A0A1J1HGZ8_9DIPT|nr:CLUMA_CG001071, isoform A [Clunio marinus]